MKDVYSKVVVGMIAVSLSILAIKNLDIIGSANAVVDHPSQHSFGMYASDNMIGEIRLFAGDFTPQGWAACDGTELNIIENKKLFAVIGSIYGGDGEETFALPDLRGRQVIGLGEVSFGREVELGDQRLFSSTIVNELTAEEQRAYTSKAEAKAKANGGGKTPNLSANIPPKQVLNNQIKTGDVGLNYIICVEGIIPDGN